MNKSTIMIVALALLVGAGGAYIVTDRNSGMEMPSTSNGNMKEVPAGMHMMPDGTLMGNPDESMSGMQGMQGMSGMDHSMMMVSSEREFVAGMIPHHQEAVDTAIEVLERGGSTEDIRTLASDIIAAQETEIAMLKEWHLAWYGEAYGETDSYQPMMRDLSQLSGAELDKRFLEDMIPHHIGAIMMAQSVRPYIEHQEITGMADAIMTTQSAEIELMQDLLTGL
jgi:uncharacterized protein (DUF305 family)